MQYITNDNYEDIVTKNKFVVIDFYADWCGPCKVFGPIFEAVQENYRDALLIKCDVSNSKRVAARFGIRSIPTTIIIKDEKEVGVQSGVMNENQLIKFINQNITKGE